MSPDDTYTSLLALHQSLLYVLRVLFVESYLQDATLLLLVVRWTLCHVFCIVVPSRDMKGVLASITFINLAVMLLHFFSGRVPSDSAEPLMRKSLVINFLAAELPSRGYLVFLDVVILGLQFMLALVSHFRAMNRSTSHDDELVFAVTRYDVADLAKGRPLAASDDLPV
ncbi:hypothetical protein AMAG_07703 [Allomyces macrogynus ATCC 38327]|uniref:DUF1746 domain-containing protein n=1 Tax=Allomyces macrogynus (strain ATCC 38327) TaxID=578462 RepID=A0A0L0SJ85_ALLM3|nr:hypothetical protein AMAG_07703 [Allomyces macrogynus ATCC 38327]|eukprot:KNE62489.1 hypothetical protein AMAG_07703 [Allomyces macrogynus ATCC 38327]